MSQYGRFYNSITDSVLDYIVEIDVKNETKIVLPIIYYWLTYTQQLELLGSYGQKLDQDYLRIIDKKNPLEHYKEFLHTYGDYFDYLYLSEDVVVDLHDYALFLEHFHSKWNINLPFNERIKRSMVNFFEINDDTKKIIFNVLNVYFKHTSRNKEQELKELENDQELQKMLGNY